MGFFVIALSHGVESGPRSGLWGQQYHGVVDSSLRQPGFHFAVNRRMGLLAKPGPPVADLRDKRPAIDY